MNFTVYSKTGCPYCEKGVDVLELEIIENLYS